MLVLPKSKIDGRFPNEITNFFEEMLDYDNLLSRIDPEEKKNKDDNLKSKIPYLRSINSKEKYDEEYISEELDYSEKSKLFSSKLVKMPDKNLSSIQNKSSLYNQYNIDSQKITEYMQKNEFFLSIIRKKLG